MIARCIRMVVLGIKAASEAIGHCASSRPHRSEANAQSVPRGSRDEILDNFRETLENTFNDEERIIEITLRIKKWSLRYGGLLTAGSDAFSFRKSILDKLLWGYPKLVGAAFNVLDHVANENLEKIRTERRSNTKIKPSTSHVPGSESALGPPQGQLITSTLVLRNVDASAFDL